MRGEKQLLGNLCNKTTICFISFLLFFIFSSLAQTPLYADVSVSDNGSNNNLGSANTSRNVAIDLNGNIYVVYANDTQIRIAKSINNGQNFLPSILINNTSSPTEPEIAVNNSGNVYIAWVENETINFTRSINGGTTFSTIEIFGTITPSPKPNPNIHMSVFENNVYLTDEDGKNVYYNNNNGVGGFNITNTGLDMVYADVLTDQNGLLYVPMDDPDLVLFQSVNQGNAITQTNLNPAGQVYFSSYALSDGPCGTFIFVGGGGGAALSETLGYKINAVTGETSEITLGANSTSFEGRTLFADNKGTLIDGYRASNGDLMISVSSDQGNTFNTPIVVANGDSHNIARSPTTNNIAVTYERNGRIFLSVYDNIIKSIEIPEPDPALVFCSSSSFDLPFTLSGIFSPGSIFSASLSDEFGDFSNATEIGTITTDASGIISCTIPTGLTPSNDYRLQVESLAICLQSNSISISIGEGSIIGDSEVCVGETLQLTNTGTPISANPWLSSNTNVATINNLGLVTTINSGTTDITFTTDNGCTVTHSIEVFNIPILDQNISLNGCDSNTNGTGSFDTSTIESTLLNGQTGMTILYFDENGNSLPSPLPNPFNSENQTITVRVQGGQLTMCSAETTIDFVVYTSPVLNTIPTFELCDENFDGTAPFDTSTLENTLLNGQTGMIVFYFDENGNLLPSPLPNPFNSESQTITVRVENEQESTCFDQTTIDFIVREKPNLNTVPAFELCDEDSNGTEDFDTSTLENTILNGQTRMTVLYFDENGNPLPSPLPNPFNSESQTITVRVENELATTCFSEITIDFLVHTNPVLNTIPTFELCDENFDGTAPFDTSTLESTLLNGQTGMSVFYFDENGNPLPSPLPNPFNSESQTITVQVENEQESTCFDQTTIDFIVREKPNLNTIPAFELCDEDSNGTEDFDTSTLENTILNGQTGMTVLYFDENGNPLPSPLPNPFNSESQTITVRVENELATSCFSEITIDFLVHTNPVLNLVPNFELCDENFDGTAPFDTSTIENTLLNGQTGMSVFYFDENGNPLPSPLPNPFNSESQTITVRVENTNAISCFTETTIDFIVDEKPTVQVDNEAVICLTDNPSLDIAVINPNSNYTYVWTDENGIEIGTGDTINVSNGGLFNVIASSLNCVSNIAQINVIESNIPVLTIDDITIHENSTNNSITINTSNLLPGDYEFSLLDENLNSVYNYQTEPFFDNLDIGLYTVLVKDIHNCGTDEVNISILNFPNFFTPNEDGINDFWTIEGFNNSFYPSSSIYIYNRYGKVMAELPAENPTWNGTFRGKRMPSTDYWYLIKLRDIYGRLREEKGHFSLLRK